jgi:thioredoxin-related protein
MKQAVKWTILCIFLFNSCNEKKFDREEYLVRFINDKIKHLIPEDKEYNLIILQTLYCGACSEEVLDAINTVLGQDTLSDNIIVMQPSRKKIKEKLPNINNATYVIDKENNIGLYGLNYPHDLYFRMAGTEIKYWLLIDEFALKKFNKMRIK